jgi:hypothetical protein
MSKKTDQRGSNVEGIQANEVNLRDYNYIAEKPKSRLRDLIARFQQEREEDTQSTETDRRLRRYQAGADSRNDGDEIIGLKQKLKRADREDLFIDANRYKESFAKCLQEYGLYSSAQKLMANLLSTVESRFHTKVAPLVRSGANEQEILSTIYDEIVQPVSEELASYPDLLHQDEILGMVYYLTGNCFLSWRSRD